MGVDVTHIIKHPCIDVDDDSICETYCNEICAKLKAGLKYDGKYTVYKNSWEDDPGTWKNSYSRRWRRNY